MPTLVLWGESDGIVTPDYGRHYASLIPGAVFETIPQAGHHPELEQPDAFVARVRAVPAMIFIVRTDAGRRPAAGHQDGPADAGDRAAVSAGQIDYFCLGDPEAAKAAGWPVVAGA